MESKRRNNPYTTGGPDSKHRVWQRGYEAAEHNMRYDRVSTTYQQGVAAGRELERDNIGEQLILMAQEFGHAQFVFTADDLEALSIDVQSLVSKLADIETLR